MKRGSGRTAAGLAVLIVSGGLASAQTPSWEEIGEGSASFPAVFQLENFDPSVEGADRASVRPELGLDRDGRPVMVFYSDTPNKQSTYNGLFALAYDAGAWRFLDEGNGGAILAEEGLILPYNNNFPMDYDLATLQQTSQTTGSAPGLLCTFGAVFPLQAFVNLYGGFYSDPGGWAGEGNSLTEGGLTAPATFNDQVFGVAGELDTFGNPYLAYARGSGSDRSIFVTRFRFGEWSGLADSDTVPIAEATTDTTHLHPSISFTGADPVVAWTEKDNTVERVKLLRFNSSTQQWEGIENSASEGLGFGRRPEVENFRNRDSFVVAFEGLALKHLTVVEWNGLDLNDLGDPLEPWGLSQMAPFNDRTSADPEPSVANFTLAMDRRGNPAVAFRAESPEGSNRYHIFVSYYDRSAGEWVAVGEADDPLGASQRAYDLPPSTPPDRGFGHYNPTLVFGPDNRPILAYEFDDAGQFTPAILARRFSHPVAPLLVTVDQAIARVLRIIDSSPEVDDQIDENTDTVIDAADVISIRNP